MADIFFEAVANGAFFALVVGLPPYLVYRHIKNQETESHKE